MPTGCTEPTLRRRRQRAASRPAASPRLNTGPTVAKHSASVLASQWPARSTPPPPAPPHSLRLAHPNPFAVPRSPAEPPAPGLSNKRIRSRLRAIYPYSLGITGRRREQAALQTHEGTRVVENFNLGFEFLVFSSERIHALR